MTNSADETIQDQHARLLLAGFNGEIGTGRLAKLKQSLVRLWNDPVTDVSDVMQAPEALTLKRALLVLAPMVLLFVGIFAFASDSIMDARTRHVVAPMLGIVSFILIVALIHLFMGYWRVARMLSISAIVACELLTVLFTGGFSHSIANPILLMIPMYIFCFYGAREGLVISACLPLLAIGSEWMLRYTELTLPNFTSGADEIANITIVLASCYLVVAVVLASLTQTNQSLRRELARERDAQTQLAHSDLLTGLSNRRGFLLQLDEAISNSVDGAITLFYLDLNGFKPINDLHGHDSGDDALRIIGQRLRAMTPAPALLARIGGDEFALAFINHNEVDPAKMDRDLLAMQIARTIAEPMRIGSHIVSVSASVGHAAYPSDDRSSERLITIADRRMLETKRNALELGALNRAN